MNNSNLPFRFSVCGNILKMLEFNYFNCRRAITKFTFFAVIANLLFANEVQKYVRCKWAELLVIIITNQ